MMKNQFWSIRFYIWMDTRCVCALSARSRAICACGWKRTSKFHIPIGNFYSQYAVTHLHNLWYFEYRTISSRLFLCASRNTRFEWKKKKKKRGHRSSRIYYYYLPICAVVFISIYLYEKKKKKEDTHTAPARHTGNEEILLRGTFLMSWSSHHQQQKQKSFFFFSFFFYFLFFILDSHLMLPASGNLDSLRDRRTVLSSWAHRIHSFVCMQSCV